jgi:murein DD-endopeptidase MepM/ murein hydrolase activator NlpD
MNNKRKLFLACLLAVLLLPQGVLAVREDIIIADGPAVSGTGHSYRPAYFRQLEELQKALAGRESYAVRRHIVARGETLSMIANKYGLSVEELIEYNRLNNPNLILPGQELLLAPAGNETVGTTASFMHTVQRGETVWGLARLYNVSMEEIIAANNITDPRTLETGRRLIIPGGSQAAGNSARTVASRAAVRSRPAETTEDPGFIWPVSGQISSKYGPRWGKFHYGLDIAASIGTPIVAAAAGKVVTAGWQPRYGYVISIDHLNGWVSVYAHCSKLFVGTGQSVQQGQKIAAVGQTGNTTGPHLHLETIYNGEHLDPLQKLPSR